MILRHSVSGTLLISLKRLLEFSSIQITTLYSQIMIIIEDPILGVQDQTLPWLRYSKVSIQNKFNFLQIFKKPLKNFPLSVQTTQHVADHSRPKEDVLNIKIVARSPV